MYDKTKTTVTIICYLTGVKSEIIDKYFNENPELLRALRKNKAATVIRKLCKIRTRLFHNYKWIDDNIRYQMKNLDSMDAVFEVEDFQWLEESGYSILKPNCRVETYIKNISILIHENIGKCEELFYDWIKWEYIRSLFIIPSIQKKDSIKKEYSKYTSNYRQYPYQVYIYWFPSDIGCLFFNDDKFLSEIYAMNGDIFKDKDKIKDASAGTKESIYEFIDKNAQIEIVVDCENSDAYKFFSVLKNLRPEKLKKISRIVMYDDIHTVDSWKILSEMLHIPVEHIDVKRVLGHKSLVDIKLTAEVVKDYYDKKIQSFIVFSSDSDYWGLISSLPEADFLVMYEWEKCSARIKEILELNNTGYCLIDDFCSGNISEFKTKVLITKFREYASDIMNKNLWDLTKQAYQDCKIAATNDEMLKFYQKYIKTIQLKVDEKGNPFLCFSE